MSIFEPPRDIKVKHDSVSVFALFFGGGDKTCTPYGIVARSKMCSRLLVTRDRKQRLGGTVQ